MSEKIKRQKSYNYKNAFNVVVNLYLIYKVYKLMGDKKADFFDKSNCDFYKDIMDISRQRFYRIFRGDNFTLKKKSDLAKMFHISESYFTAEGDWIGLHTVSETDWKYYFTLSYADGTNPFKVNVPEKVMSDTVKRIDKLLNETIQNKLIESTYDVDEPLYRVYYYFKHNVAYKEETQLTKFTRELAKLKITDWDEMFERKEELVRYGEMLDKHNRYIQSALTYLTLRNE